jgi:hypothetical protein
VNFTLFTLTFTDRYRYIDDSNVNTKETEKLSKYKDLEMAVRRMWKVRTKIVPVIIGALGTIKKGLDQSLQFLSGHLSATELQKITMSTAHSIRKVYGVNRFDFLLTSGLTRRQTPNN